MGVYSLPLPSTALLLFSRNISPNSAVAVASKWRNVNSPATLPLFFLQAAAEKANSATTADKAAINIIFFLFIFPYLQARLDKRRRHIVLGGQRIGARHIHIRTAGRIMTKTATKNDITKIVLIIVLVIVVAVVIIIIMNQRRKHERERNEETKKILETPLE